MVLLSQSSVLFVGLARNCALKVGRSIEKMLELGQLWARADYLIITNDNSDDTELAITATRLREMGGKLHVLDGLAEKISSRTERLAYARNEGLRAMWAMEQVPQYLIMMDMDGVNDELITGDAFLAAIASAPDNWAGLFANQTTHYYDIYALRKRGWCTINIGWLELWAQLLPWRWIAKTVVGARQVSIPRHAPSIEVESAFGGFGLYKTKYLDDCHYCGTKFRRDICEHVAFHRSVCKKGIKLYILPSLLNSSPAEHLHSPSMQSKYQKRYDRGEFDLN